MAHFQEQVNLPTSGIDSDNPGLWFWAGTVTAPNELFGRAGSYKNISINVVNNVATAILQTTEEIIAHSLTATMYQFIGGRTNPTQRAVTMMLTPTDRVNNNGWYETTLTYDSGSVTLVAWPALANQGWTGDLSWTIAGRTSDMWLGTTQIRKAYKGNARLPSVDRGLRRLL